MSKVRQCFANRDYLPALEKALEVFEQVIGEKSLNIPRTKAETAMVLAQLYLCLHEPFLAECYARFALNCVSNGQKEAVYELLFFCNFKTLNTEALMELVALNRHVNDPAQACKWTLFEAACLHQQGKYRESLHTLQNERGTWGDKSGIAVAHKMLELMNLIDLHQYEWIELRLDALRKLLKRFWNRHTKGFTPAITCSTNSYCATVTFNCFLSKRHST
ncbi:MAG: hypothetical protein HC896_07745 [Bacteroidales bacterium]|nr:hypothetical protein [Bacteroidales bacterium]